jgi:hypothetical protein
MHKNGHSVSAKDQTRYLAEVVVKALRGKHPPGVAEDALLLAAALADAARKSPRGPVAVLALNTLNSRKPTSS